MGKALFAAALAARCGRGCLQRRFKRYPAPSPAEQRPAADDEETQVRQQYGSRNMPSASRTATPKNMRLTAWFIPRKGHRYAIICHGYGGRAECMRHRGKVVL